MQPRRTPSYLALVLLLCALGPSPLRADEDEKKAPPKAAPTFSERVDKAIDGGVAWLKRLQQRDGSWGPCVGASIGYHGNVITDPTCYTTGPTSFTLFTLARCGVPRDDPVMKKGLKWIRKQLHKAPLTEKSVSGHEYVSYESASAVLMFTAIYNTRKPLKPSRSPMSRPKGSPFTSSDWQLMTQLIKHLVGSGSKKGCQMKDGSWAYRRTRRRGDVSATTFALLALRAAVRAGYPLERARRGVWTKALGYLETMQNEDGSFHYKPKEEWSAGMTAAGVASLLICREQIRLLGKQPPTWADDAIKRGMDHLGKHYDPAVNAAGSERAGRYYHYCYIYAVERVGSLARRHLLAGRNWYQLGAEALLEWQAEDGHWDDRSCMRPTKVLGTCFALLFLKRSTMPVITGAPQPK